MKNYIDNGLNSSKKNFLDSTKEDYKELKSTDEIPASLEIQNMIMERYFQFLMTMILRYITRGHQIYVL